MPAATRIRELLPSLWRPPEQAASDDLLASLIDAIGALLDTASVAAGDVMQSHWYRYADSALTSPYVAQFRSLAGKPPLTPGDPEVSLHPYLRDLARLAGVFDLAPWSEPLEERDTVEEFRRRIARVVALHRGGLGTRAALRRVTLASLPVADRAAPPGLHERGFTVEESAPIRVERRRVTARGAPADLVGPLMRWRIDSGANAPTTPEIYIEGIAPVPNELDATTDPIIERFDPTTGTGIGIAYEGTVAPGQTLAILPAVASWLGTTAGIVTAFADSAPGRTLDPTARGPWSPAAGAPDGVARAFAVAPDGALWAPINRGGGGAILRLSAAGWDEVASGLPELNCMLAVGQDLLVGHANGLARLPSVGGPPVPVPDPSAASEPAVRALARDRAGRVWAARATGAAVLGSDDSFTEIGPGARSETVTQLHAVLTEPDGLVYFGGDAGLFLHDPKSGRWHVYRGETADESVPDWAPWDPANDPLPDDAETFLPPVSSLLRDSLGILWIGTAAGLAAYGAWESRRTYTTGLLAFPELGTGEVTTLAEDERQRLWAGTARGLLIYDGVDWHQSRGGTPTRLPRSESDGLPRTRARFNRARGVWHVYEPSVGDVFTTPTLEPLTTDETSVTAIAWTDHATAQLGTLDGDAFIPDASATPAALGSRFKPDAVRVVDGGIPAVPRLTPGASDWRYLAREGDAPPTHATFPSWTREGRLLPPPEVTPPPQEGRYLTDEERALLEQVFSYSPAARVRFVWRPRAALSIVVRLEPATADEVIAPAVLDRLVEGLEQVRPAGSRVALAVGGNIVRDR